MHIGGCDYSKWAETTIFVSVDMGGCAYRNGTFVPSQIRTTGLTANALPSRINVRTLTLGINCWNVDE